MTVVDRVRRTKAALEVVVAVSALLWGAAAAIAIVIAADLLAAATPLPGAGALQVRAFALIAGAIVAGAIVWRSRFAWVFERVALWIEERAPELRYSLVTASDERYAASLSAVTSPMMDSVDTAGFVRLAAIRAVTPAALAFAAIALLSVVIPANWREPIATNWNAFDRASEKALLAGSKLTPLTARIIPPAYSGLGAERIDEPSTVSGIQGSRVTIEGPGGPGGPGGIAAQIISADGRRATVPVTGGGNRWSLSLAMPDTTPSVLELTDRSYNRAIVVNPRADAPPAVKLQLPARDTALRTASGTLRLSADIADDIGIASAAFEYIISSGSDETFSFKQGTLGAERFSGGKSRTLFLEVPYSFFKLGEGDRLSVRAVASDVNSFSGPGRGFSETRTIRIARKDEYDSLSVEAAAPSGDTAMMSLRMLILETEKLDKQRPKIVRDTLVARSTGLARQTDQVRAAVLPLEKEEGTGAPEITMDTETSNQGVQVAAQVREALNDLEEASRKLDIADPHSALPPMYKAYKALQSFRNFKRYYFRGATRPVIVDIQRVRLTGKTKGTAAPMSPRSAATSDRDRMRAEYSSAIELIPAAPSRAVMMLTILRVEALKKYPALSAALENALVTIGHGRDATAALLGARRILEGSPNVTDSLPAWSGGL
ncbi:MAG: hypothetical protein M3Z17_05135 [Gemmatimonadota bacterium]|nr:hypothetical protein [Gemmatimonadota bacterium]